MPSKILATDEALDIVGNSGSVKRAWAEDDCYRLRGAACLASRPAEELVYNDGLDNCVRLTHPEVNRESWIVYI